MAYGQVSFTLASRFVAASGAGFLTSSDLDPFSALLGDPERAFASQQSHIGADNIFATGAAADASAASVSMCEVDFEVLEAVNFELTFTLFGEGTFARLIRDPDGLDEGVVSLVGSNQLIVAGLTAGTLETGRYRFELSTSGGPEVVGGTPWFYSVALTVPTPASALPLLGLAGLAARRRR